MEFCKSTKKCTPIEKRDGASGLEKERDREKVEKRTEKKNEIIHKWCFSSRRRRTERERKKRKLWFLALSLFLSLFLPSNKSLQMAAPGAATMIPLRALPAGGGHNKNANAGALAKGSFPNLSSAAPSAARRAAMLLLASPEVVVHGGEDLLLTVARLLRGVAARGRDLGGGSAEWAYDLLPDSAATTTGKDDADADAGNAAADKQRRTSSSAAASSPPSTSGRAATEVWKAASGESIEVSERAFVKSAFFFSFFSSSPLDSVDSPDVFRN